VLTWGRSVLCHGRIPPPPMYSHSTKHANSRDHSHTMIQGEILKRENGARAEEAFRPHHGLRSQHFVVKMVPRPRTPWCASDDGSSTLALPLQGTPRMKTR
jgi:hypothetical protein